MLKFGKVSFSIFVCLLLLLIVITGCTKQKILDHDNQQWDYKPMISKNNDIYGDAGRIEKSLPEAFVLLGTIKEKISQNEAMIHGKSYYISNTLSR